MQRLAVMPMHNRPENRDQSKCIAVVVPRYGLVGGGEKLVYELTERIAADHRWRVHVFANRWQSGSESIQFHHVPILTFPRFMTPLSFALFARRKINRVGVDLIHTHERILDAHIYSVHGIPHTIWVKQIRRKRVMSLFDYTLANIERRLINSPNCKHLLAVSSITAEKLNQAFNGISDRIKIVSPGIDRQPFTRWVRQDCRKTLREQFGWHADDLVLLFVGMNFEIKGLDVILKSLGLACRASPDVTIRLLVVGKGNIRKYRQLAESLGLRDHVALSGPIHSDIERIYLGSDFFILMSQFDTFGLVVLEAMAAGLPVIISRNVGARDMVEENANGFVVDGDNCDVIADKIKILARRDQRVRMGLAAANTARNHDWQAMADTVSELYAMELQC